MRGERGGAQTASSARVSQSNVYVFEYVHVFCLEGASKMHRFV